MQQVLKQAIEQMVRLGSELNWNPPIDHEYVNALNDLRAILEAAEHSVQSDLPIVCDNCFVRRASGDLCENCGSPNTASR